MAMRTPPPRPGKPKIPRPNAGSMKGAAKGGLTAKGRAFSKPRGAQLGPQKDFLP